IYQHSCGLRGEFGLWVELRPSPGHEFIEALVGPEIDKSGDHIGEPSLRIDAVELGCFDQRGNDGPVLGAIVMAGKEGVLASERLGPHGASTMLVSSSMRPSSRKRVRPSQCRRP